MITKYTTYIKEKFVWYTDNEKLEVFIKLCDFSIGYKLIKKLLYNSHINSSIKCLPLDKS